MTKSKTKASSLKTVQGDFSLQVPRHGLASQTTRALTRSRSPVQQVINSASPMPRKKAVLVDFVSPSSGVRVSSKRRSKHMQRNSSSHSSTACSACSACNEGSYENFRSHITPNECLAGSHPRCSHPGSGNLTRGSSPIPPPQPPFW